MKVWVAHVPYQHRGGEDVHVDVLCEAYRSIGIEPVLFPQNREPSTHSLASAARSLSLGGAFPAADALFRQDPPRLIHLHNAFPELGPRFFRWVIEREIPMIMTVHNHRFYCTNGVALRDGKICKDCLGASVPWRPLVYNCNDSHKKSAYHAMALAEMRLGDLYLRAVRKFIAPSPYIRDELVRAGIPAAMVTLVLNPLPLPEESAFELPQARRVFYAGRLSEEKGIAGYVSASRLLSDVQFVIAGDGPLRAQVEAAARELDHVTYLGNVSREEVARQIQKSRVTLLPSICNEILPTFVLESFFYGRRCVLPALESTRWLAEGEFPGHAVDTTEPKDIARGIREALAAPAVERSVVVRMRDRFAMRRFSDELKTVVKEQVGFNS